MLGSCMGPIAMLLTGMAIAKINLKEGFANVRVYVISAVRLVVLPLLFMLAVIFLPIPYEIKLCTVCATAMPLGLSTIVIPSAYGLDTKVASGMALVSHLLSCITIPLVFMLFDAVIKI
jgi:predicted permease